MGASRKLQGEIDRVLKKVQEGVDVFESIWNKVYDTENLNQKEKFEADLKKEIKKLQRYRDQIKTWLQSSEIKDKRALMDARKQIEREMERFKICEKETKTKAFSKEGLVQQPKTDPKEKAKSETREWINTVVADLESQIENFEAEVENLSAKKGKAKTTRLEHLETSITRHKAHIMKLELLLRLLDNEELSPEQVNDVKDFLYDYVERNQDDFDEFSNVDELYSTLPLDKVETLEDLVAVSTSALIKGVGSLSGSTSPLSLKNSVASSSNQLAVVSGSTSQDQSEETSSLESNSDVVLRTPPKDVTGSIGSSIPLGISSGTGPGPTAAVAVAVVGNTSSVNLVNVSTATAVLPNPGSTRILSENITINAAPGVNPSLVKEDDNLSLLSRRSSPAPSEISIGRGIGKGSLVGVVSNPPSSNSSMTLGSIGSFHGAVTLGTIPSVSDAAKRNVQGADEKSGTANLAQPLLSPLTNKLFLQQTSKLPDNHGLLEINNAGESPVTGGRGFSPSAIGGIQWRSPNVNSFQNQSETPQFRGRTEIAPDQREKYLQRFQQVQQQGAGSHLNISHLPGIGQKPFYSQQQSSLLQKLSSQSSPVSSQVGTASQPLGISSASSPQPQTLVHQQLSQQSAVLRDLGQVKIEDQQLILSDGLNGEPTIGSGPNNSLGENDLKATFRVSSATSLSDSFQQPKDVDLSLGQPTPSNQSATTPGVIGRRATSDLGAIGDNINGAIGFSAGIPDQNFNLQMLESAYYKLPQPRDSERVKTYIPRHPAATPPSYPQAPSALFDNPAFWERLSLENGGTDTLFFAFYHQQKTYQQYLAARELKRQSWRYHKKYNTWFQRHEEPKVTTDDYEQGTYVYFDFHIADDGSQNGWCQRIKTEFRFEYNFLEDELPV